LGRRVLCALAGASTAWLQLSISATDVRVRKHSAHGFSNRLVWIIRRFVEQRALTMGRRHESKHCGKLYYRSGVRAVSHSRWNMPAFPPDTRSFPTRLLWAHSPPNCDVRGRDQLCPLHVTEGEVAGLKNVWVAVDPELPFEIDPMNGRTAGESGLRLIRRLRQYRSLIGVRTYSSRNGADAGVSLSYSGRTDFAAPSFADGEKMGSNTLWRDA
jgi:hypothetical protein